MMSKKNRIALIQRALSLTSGLSSAKAGKSRVFRNSVFVAGAFAASTTFAQTPAAAPAAEPVYELEALTTTAEGQSRATNSITFADLETKMPGVSLEKALGAVPGVNVRTTDPFGFYEGGNDIRVRSFDISKIAVTFDDMPMGSNSGRYGTPAGRMADSENVANISVSQGTGDVTTAANEALGGSIAYSLIDPAKDPSALIKFSTGSFDAQRTFVRYQTGEILPGLTSYVSLSKFQFKTAGVPDDSDVSRVESKIKKTYAKGNVTFSYTYNDRADFDTKSIQYDRWKALETGNPYAAYPVNVYGATSQNARILNAFAKNGYIEYSPYNTTTTGLTADDFNQFGDYTDGARTLGPTQYIDPSQNQGDRVNSTYYLRWRNMRTDHIYRARNELNINDDLKLISVGYYQTKDNTGLFPVSRGDARTQIQNAYLNTDSNGTTNASGTRIVNAAQAAAGYSTRPDIWPEYLWKKGGALVPAGTPGATAVGYTDSNGSGFYDLNNGTAEALDLTKTVTAFSGNHALAVKGGTAPALIGATAREEQFTGVRYGTTQKFEYTGFENQKIRTGFWWEHDEQSAYRPTLMLVGDSITGDYIRDRMLFLNYYQNFQTDSLIGYVEDQISLMDKKLKLTIGTKMMTIDRQADGFLTTPGWWRNAKKANSATFEDFFLPQLGAAYKINQNYEVFASYAENLAAPDYGVIASDTFSSALKPEQSANYDFGVRYNSPNFSATLAGFLNLYKDRILSVALTQEELVAAGLSGVTGATNYRNVGDINAYGSEFAFDWKTPVPNLSVAGSVAYQIAEFQDNITVGTSAFHSDATDPRSKYYKVLGGNKSSELVKGKSLGNTPELTTQLDLRYKLGNWRATFGGRYYDAVYVNTLNTEEIPSYTTFNASLKYDFPKGSKMDPFAVLLTVDNLFDQTIWYAGGYNGSFNGSVRADYGQNISLTVSAEF